MKTIWFTADHHFGHENIIKYCDRPFKYVDEMDSELIRRWNEVVKPKDDVWHLGDITLQDDIHKIIRNLNGNIYLVPGNHDKRWMKKHWNEDLFTKTGQLYIKNYISEAYFHKPGEKYPLMIVVLCHYALRVWNRRHYGSLHLYGHSHGNLDPWPGSMDVGVDCHNFYPINLHQVLEHFNVNLA